MDPARKCSHTGFWVVITLLLFSLLVSLFINGGLFLSLVARGGGRDHGKKGEDEFPKFTEQWSYGTGDVKAVRIAVEGVIFRERDSGLFGARYDPVEIVLRQVRAARNDEDVGAIILEVDSPGGGLTASDEIYKALVDFKASDTNRKLVVHVKDLAASGGYYVSAPADWILAEPTALVGSIGVILQTLNWKMLSEKIGVTDTTIKSGENKDLLNPFRDVPPEQLAMLQDIIDRLYHRFFTIVQEARGIDAETLKPLADGRIFTTEQALEHKLIDGIGYWEDAVTKTAELLGKPSVKVVRYEYHPGFFELLSQARSPLTLRGVLNAQTPRPMLLWKP